MEKRMRWTTVCIPKKRRSNVSKNQETERRPWDNLPQDILRIIKGKLYLSDQVRFGAVCKSWRCNRKLPWAMTYCPNKIFPIPGNYYMGFAFELYDPTERRIYQANFPESDWFHDECHRSHKVLASKNGWLLIKARSGLLASPTTILALYSPFLDLVISSVPRLGYVVDVATFSTPTASSSYCMIFALYCCWLGKTHLGTYSFGDRNWRTLIVAERKTAPEAKSVVYVEEAGVLYYIFNDGMLGCFNFARQYWTILTESFPGHFFLSSTDGFHLFKSEGNIMLATVDKAHEWRIFSFDKSEMTWIPEISLGERALFASPTSFLAGDLGDAAPDLADCIYFFDAKTHQLKVFSLNNQQLRNPEYKPLRDIGWIKFGCMLKIFIQPPNV